MNPDGPAKAAIRVARAGSVTFHTATWLRPAVAASRCPSGENAISAW